MEFFIVPKALYNEHTMIGDRNPKLYGERTSLQVGAAVFRRDMARFKVDKVADKLLTLF